MVLFVLRMKAELENVASVTLRPKASLCLTVRNPLSDWEVREQVIIDPSSFVEQDESSREPPHHFQIKWEGNSKPSTLTVFGAEESKAAIKKLMKKKAKGSDALPGPYTVSGAFSTVLMVECRGLEPTEFFPRTDEFIVESEGGTCFDEEVDLSDGDWADYDADHEVPVSMTDLEFQWESIK